MNVTTYTNTGCTAGAKAAAYQLAVGSGSPLTQPAGVLLTRKPNDFTSITHLIPIALNPGALTHEVRYAKGGVIGPDGAISGRLGDGVLRRDDRRRAAAARRARRAT